MADIFDTLNNYDRRLRQLETKPMPSASNTTGGGTPSGLPEGGVQYDMLIKSSATNYDAEWVEGIPTGGTTGQVLAKASDSNYDMEWVDQATSSGGATSPTFVASSSASSTGTATTLSINMPTGVTEGDLVVIFCASDTTTAPTIPSGGWTSYLSATDNNIGRNIFYKFMTTTPDTSASITISGTNASAALAYAFRNVYTPAGFSSPIKFFASAADASASGMPDAPAVTTTYANELIFILGVVDDDSGVTATAPTGFTNGLSVGGGASAGSNITVMAAIKTDAAVGTTDPAAFGGAGSDDWNAYSITFWNVSSLIKKEIMVAASDETTALTTGSAKVTFRAPENMYLSSTYLPRASVTTAPTGTTLLTVDINDAGTSILSTKLTFDAGEKTTTTATTTCVLSSTLIGDDDEITVDIDAVGSTVAGAGLKVTIYYLSAG